MFSLSSEVTQTWRFLCEKFEWRYASMSNGTQLNFSPWFQLIISNHGINLLNCLNVMLYKCETSLCFLLIVLVTIRKLSQEWIQRLQSQQAPSCWVNPSFSTFVFYELFIWSPILLGLGWEEAPFIYLSYSSPAKNIATLTIFFPFPALYAHR